MPSPTASQPSPGPADLALAPETLPDGPNVAPSAHEHEAAMGTLAQDGADGTGPAPGASLGEGESGEEEYEDGSDDRQHRIRTAAYALSAQRGFEPGRDVDDWLEAERQIDAGSPPPPTT